MAGASGGAQAVPALIVATPHSMVSGVRFESLEGAPEFGPRRLRRGNRRPQADAASPAREASADLVCAQLVTLVHRTHRGIGAGQLRRQERRGIVEPGALVHDRPPPPGLAVRAPTHDSPLLEWLGDGRFGIVITPTMLERAQLPGRSGRARSAGRLRSSWLGGLAGWGDRLALAREGRGKMWRHRRCRRRRHEAPEPESAAQREEQPCQSFTTLRAVRREAHARTGRPESAHPDA